MPERSWIVAIPIVSLKRVGLSLGSMFHSGEIFSGFFLQVAFINPHRFAGIKYRRRDGEEI